MPSSAVVYICSEMDTRASTVLNECVHFNVLHAINDKFIGIHVAEKVLKITFKFCKIFFLKQWLSYSNEDVHFLQLLLIFLTCWSTYRHNVIVEHLLPYINKTSIVRDVAWKNPGSYHSSWDLVTWNCCTISLNTFVKRSISNHHNLCFIAPLGNSSIVPQSFRSHFHHLFSLLAIFGRNPERIRHKNCKEMILHQRCTREMV